MARSTPVTKPRPRLTLISPPACVLFAAFSPPPANNMSGVDLGGKTLTPGVYRYDTSANSAGALTLDAQNNPGARFVIQIGTTLITSSSSFTGNTPPYTSITTVSGTAVTGRLLALSGAVTLDTNNVTIPGLSATP